MKELCTVKENYYSDIAKDSQMLLLPDVVTLTHKEMDVAKENKEMFEQAGFYFEEFGENTIKLTGVPTVCIDLDTKELFLETLDEINTVARTAKQEKEEKFIATVWDIKQIMKCFRWTLKNFCGRKDTRRSTLKISGI